VAPLRVTFSDSALRDLQAVQAWYAEAGVPEVGERLVREVLARAHLLAEQPDMGRVVPEFGQPFLRELIHPPFRIVYRRDPSKVRVVRVWRAERLMRPEGLPHTRRDE
jgi:toxin ParE1/3/4